jgi:hypothetical protein
MLFAIFLWFVILILPSRRRNRLKQVIKVNYDNKGFVTSTYTSTSGCGNTTKFESTENKSVQKPSIDDGLILKVIPDYGEVLIAILINIDFFDNLQ